MDHLDIDVTLARRTFDLRAELSVGAETVALVGVSGSGKTSLLRTVAGLDRPEAGRIAFGGEIWFDAARADRSQARSSGGWGTCPQDYALFPHLSVAGNVRFAGRRDRPDLLERLGHRPSGGRPTRPSCPVASASASRWRARWRASLRVLLLDEPFGALDAMTRQRVRDELADMLATLRLPTLLVTHAFDDANALAARVGVLDAGRLVQLDAPAAVLATPASAAVAAVTGANLRDGRGAHRADRRAGAAGRGREAAERDACRGPGAGRHLSVGDRAGRTGHGDADRSRHQRSRRQGRAARAPAAVRRADRRRRRADLAIGEGALVGLRVAAEHVRLLDA